MNLRITCQCGENAVELHGAPVARANCHCTTCRDFYGAAMLSATAWDRASVVPAATNTTHFQHPAKQLSKTFCRQCGDVLFGTNRLGLYVVPNAVVARAAGGVLDAALVPTMHLFYRERVIDVSDALPKYLDGWDGPVHVA
ncbi:MAG: GFA family protein [Stenotrophomonas sp.]